MTIAKRLRENGDDIFCCFEAAYLFGSALVHKAPADIDLILVHGSASDLTAVSAQAQRSQDILMSMFEGLMIDLTVLSRTEFEHSNFLDVLPMWIKVR